MSLILSGTHCLHIEHKYDALCLRQFWGLWKPTEDNGHKIDILTIKCCICGVEYIPIASIW